MCVPGTFAFGASIRFTIRSGARERNCAGRFRKRVRDRLNRFAVAIAVLFGLISLAHAQAPDNALEIAQVAPGVFVHFGVNEMMTPENEGGMRMSASSSVMRRSR